MPPVTLSENAFAKIVIVDDDPGIRELLTGFLNQHGLGAEAVDSGTALRVRLDQRPCDLVILDLLMPGEDGLSILRSLLRIERPPGVIMFSAIASEVDRVVALELGADDYVTKPSSPREMLARVRSVLRRRMGDRVDAAPSHEKAARADPAERLRFNGWTLDRGRRGLLAPTGEVVSISLAEFEMMLTFALNPRTIVSRERIAALSGQAGCDISDRSVDVKISRLRRKLAEWQPDELIRTVRNQGYLFLPAVDGETP